jgi:anti-anti-sigma factor
MINIEKQGKIDIITFNVDKINALITDDLKNEIGKIVDNSHPLIILDLTGIQYIDSTGFGCFLSVYKTARNNFGMIRFVSPEPSVYEALKTLKLDTIFDIFTNLEDCIKSFRI